ncbi:MAG: hypothetical protein DCC64_10610 [Planctomycetota bacterium]|nr:MAG: hypothetical protein DCC64_10610 [Planctomycetota bacterium]
MQQGPTDAGVARQPMMGVWLALGAYVLAFSLFYPQVLTISDETSYMRQAWAYAQGHATVEALDPASLKVVQVLPSDYPPGTSLLMAPLMAAGGWRAGFLLGPACSCLVVLLLAHWLGRMGRSPLFALLFLCYPATLVVSRCGMSETPSAALVSLALYLFWFARGRRAWMAAAGFVAGVSLLLRETNALVCAFFFLGSLLRREQGWWALVAGGLAGTALRPLAFEWLLGNALHVKGTHPPFSWSAVPGNMPFHLGALLLLFPAGLLWVALYRGPRRLELWATVAGFLALYLLFDYNAAASAGLKQWVLTSRFFIPLLPLLVIAAAESCTVLSGSLASSPGARVALARLQSLAAPALVLAAISAAWIVHWQHQLWASQQRGLLLALYTGTEADAPVVTNLDASARYVNEIYAAELGPRLVLSMDTTDEGVIRRVLGRFGRCTIALVERRDSERWQQVSTRRLAWAEGLKEQFDVEATTTAPVGSGERVHFWTVRPRKP